MPLDCVVYDVFEDKEKNLEFFLTDVKKSDEGNSNLDSEWFDNPNKEKKDKQR